MVAKATVPFPGHEPADEMDEALCRLRTLRLALLASSQKIADYNPGDAEMMIGEVLGQLEPIRNFLAENTLKGEEMSFLECRREWFARKGGVA